MIKIILFLFYSFGTSLYLFPNHLILDSTFTTVDFELIPRQLFDTTISHRRFNANIFDSKIENVTFDNCSFINCDFSNSIFESTIINKCTFENKEYVHSVKIKNSTINNSKIEIAFSNSEFTKLNIIKSTISEIKFLGCKIDTLSIINSNINKLYIVNSTINYLIILGDSVKEINFNNNICNNVQMISFVNTSFKIKGGKYLYLNIDDIQMQGDKVGIEEAILEYPDFTLNSIKYIDLTNAAISESNFTLKIEKETDENKFSLKQSRINYLEARNVYSLIRNQFINYDMSSFERELYYKIHLIDRKLMSSSLSKLFDNIFHDQLRGGYGLFPGKVLQSSLFIWIIFSLIYFLFGFSKFAWGMLLSADGLGNTYIDSEPEFIDRKKCNTLQYVNLCLIFSFEQLLIIGFRAFEISTLLKGFKYSPSYFIPIGIGRTLATVQNILGLILLISFVQAFINSI